MIYGSLGVSFGLFVASLPNIMMSDHLKLYKLLEYFIRYIIVENGTLPVHEIVRIRDEKQAEQERREERVGAGRHIGRYLGINVSLRQIVER